MKVYSDKFFLPSFVPFDEGSEGPAGNFEAAEGAGVEHHENSLQDVFLNRQGSPQVPPTLLVHICKAVRCYLLPGFSFLAKDKEYEVQTRHRFSLLSTVGHDFSSSLVGECTPQGVGSENIYGIFVPGWAAASPYTTLYAPVLPRTSSLGL